MSKRIFLILDSIRSRENVGSIFRTADAFGISRIYLCGITPTPPHDKIFKTALGAEKNVPWEYHKQAWRLADKLVADGISLIALEQDFNSKNLSDYKPSTKKPLALIVGNEVGGVSKSLLARVDKIIEIPMRGQKESLNVAVATGIALYSFMQK